MDSAGRFQGLRGAPAGLMAGLMLMAAASALAAQGPTPGGAQTGDGAAQDVASDRPWRLQLTEAQKLVNALPPPERGMGGGRSPLPPDAPKPSPDPRNLEGAWSHGQNLELRNTVDMFGLPTPYTMAAATVIARRVAAKKKGVPFANASVKCLPPGPSFQLDLNFPFQIFQSAEAVEFVFEEFHGRWRVALDPRVLPSSEPKQYMGRSLGHWEGNTLVVETSDFKEDMWFDSDGAPISKAGKMTHRIRKVDDGKKPPYLEIIVTVEDPLYYTEPWSVARLFNWVPNRALFHEYNCEEQVGDPSGINNSGLPSD